MQEKRNIVKELEITKRKCTESIRGVEKFKVRKVKEIQEELAVDSTALSKVVCP